MSRVQQTADGATGRNCKMRNTCCAIYACTLRNAIHPADVDGSRKRWKFSTGMQRIPKLAELISVLPATACLALSIFRKAHIPFRRLRRNFPVQGSFGGSRSNEIWAKADVTGLSRTCRGRHGEVGIVEFGLNTPDTAANPHSIILVKLAGRARTGFSY